KYAEVLKKYSGEEAELARGILRIEVQHRKPAVDILVKNYDLSKRSAKRLLQKHISDSVLNKALEDIHFNDIEYETDDLIDNLINERSSTQIRNLLGNLSLFERYGTALDKIPSLGINKRTSQR